MGNANNMMIKILLNFKRLNLCFWALSKRYKIFPNMIVKKVPSKMTPYLFDEIGFAKPEIVPQI